MPFIETTGMKPEWLDTYQDTCLLRTIESMFSQCLGRTCRAPQAVYQTRCRQVEVSKTALRTGQPISVVIRHESFNLREIVECWVRSDHDLSSYISRFNLKFINQPYSELLKMVKAGVLLGVVISFDFSKGGHIFHLKLNKDSRLYDASDFGDLKIDIEGLIDDSSIRLVNEHMRLKTGVSGLLLTSWC